MHYLYNHRWAGSFGAGFRYGNKNSWLLGLNSFYDFRQTKERPFNQAGFGIEYLSDLWEFHLNSYFQLGNKGHIVKDCLFNDYIGDYFIRVIRSETSLGGADAEAGVYLLSSPSLKLYTGVGGYFLKYRDCVNRIGFRARATLDLIRMINLECSATHDKVFKTCFQMKLGIHIPFPITSIDLSFLEKSLRPVQRRDVIQTHTKCKWIWNY